LIIGYNKLNQLVKLDVILYNIGGMPKLKIIYKNNVVEKYFENFNFMKKEKGLELTRTIKKRYEQLKASENFSIYLSTGLGKPHPLYENLKGRYGISITGNIRLIVKPVVENLNTDSLKNCKTIIIEGVMDYHGRKNEWIIP
jgi:hypothetical protein